jgi:hypothetical protein
LQSLIFTFWIKALACPEANAQGALDEPLSKMPWVWLGAASVTAAASSEAMEMTMRAQHLIVLVPFSFIILCSWPPDLALLVVGGFTHWGRPTQNARAI